MSLKERHAQTTKGTSSVCDYLLSINSITDELSLINHPIDDIDLVIATIIGLGPSFQEFSASICIWYTPLMFDLVAFENFLQRDECHSNYTQPTPIMTNLANCENNHHSRDKSI
ncbi:hypothetical protein CR513_32618, partial [Mucuna pruriens]